MALWASGKGMQAIINGLNTIYHVKETRNWLMNRIYSVFYMLLFVLAIIVTGSRWLYKKRFQFWED